MKVKELRKKIIDSRIYHFWRPLKDKYKMTSRNKPGITKTNVIREPCNVILLL